MSFHYSNFGSFGGKLKRFADLNGYVPQEGDSHENMTWDAMTEWDDDSWDSHVAEAVAATAAAEKELDAWRAENGQWQST